MYAFPSRASASPRSSSTSCRWPPASSSSKGNLYVATNTKIYRYDNIEDKLDNPGEPKVIYDKLPGGNDHSWKFLRIKDDKLYFPIGAPCNICDPGEYAKIYRMNLDGSGIETIASGVRNTVGFDFDPKTGDLWFTDNGRDWFSEELPNDELNVVTQPGKQHFGYPYCHQGNIPDPEFGWGKSCDDYVKPAALLGPHAGSLGLKFYTGKMFPAKYQGAMFIARHGPWNRTKKYADVSVAWPDGKGGAKVEPFMTGFVENNTYLGRPVDFLVHEGRLAARQRRPRRSDLPHQLRRQVMTRARLRGLRGLRSRRAAGGGARAGAPRSAQAASRRQPRARPPRRRRAPPPRERPPTRSASPRVCAACHGANGRSDMPGTPVLAGQHSLLCDHAAVPVPRRPAQQRGDDGGRQDA